MDYPVGPRASDPISEQTRTNRLRHFLTSGKLVLCPWRFEAQGGIAIVLLAIIFVALILLGLR
jgi:hypothetical protein